MANNDQLIAQLREAIDKSTTSQAQLEENTGLFNTVIADGLRAINTTILEINGLLREITDKINTLQNRIRELEADAGPNPDAAHAAVVEDLNRQLAEAQQAKIEATEVMNSALITLNGNATVMDRTMNVQKTTDMQNQLQLVHQSLLEMRKNLGDVLRGGPGPPPKPRRPKPGPPKPLKPGRRGALPGEAVPPGDQGAADIDNDEEFQQELENIDGGSRRRRRTNKKRRKTRRTKTKKTKKQTGGYGYKTKQRKSTRKSTYDSDTASSDSDLGRGRGRGIYKKSKKRRSARS